MNKQDFIDSLNFLKVKSRETLSDYNFSEFLISINQKCFNKIQSYKPDLLAKIYVKFAIQKELKNTKHAAKF